MFLNEVEICVSNMNVEQKLSGSFIAALYIDKDLEYVHTFMNVCFFPRLKEFILNQDWNDPKSQLQQCCLTLRTEGKEPDIPLYK
ncbi:hypothetical protein XENOCAPTIV_001284 [Xenoophorus captivus]|uniref:Uncharacterized protein n=1 Tax=Xenoophorus captivus TaxID=1517983 RepID=A0ABV0QXR5_9TELE